MEGCGGGMHGLDGERVGSLIWQPLPLPDSSVTFSADSGIWEMEDRERRKEHMNQCVPQLKLSMIQGVQIANTRDGIGKVM